MEELAARVREALEQHGRPRGRTVPYPTEVRELAKAYVRRGRARGESWPALAERVGIKPSTLQNWYLRNGTAKKNVSVAPLPVRVTPDVVESANEQRTFAIVSPSGYRVEGLSIDEAAELLARLR